MRLDRVLVLSPRFLYAAGGEGEMARAAGWGHALAGCARDDLVAGRRPIDGATEFGPRLLYPPVPYQPCAGTGPGLGVGPGGHRRGTAVDVGFAAEGSGPAVVVGAGPTAVDRSLGRLRLAGVHRGSDRSQYRRRLGHFLCGPGHRGSAGVGCVPFGHFAALSIRT